MTDDTAAAQPIDAENVELVRLDRLRDVARLDLDLDQPRPQLQAVVEEVADTAAAPIALITVLLDDAQAFAAATGLPDWAAALGGTPVEWAFCRAMLTTGEAFAVPDLTQSPRFKDNPLVRNEGIRSYAGAPLVSARGHVLGGLCVLDVEPHDFDDTTLELLRAQAARVVALVEQH